jgi:hypothetical protein
MDAQAGLDPCWSQTHYVGFVMTWLILTCKTLQVMIKHVIKTFS